MVYLYDNNRIHTLIFEIFYEILSMGSNVKRMLELAFALNSITCSPRLKLIWVFPFWSEQEFVELFKKKSDY